MPQPLPEFPIPLTPFEEYEWYEDRVAPARFLVRFDFDGEIRREPFERSLRKTLERHPLLAARISSDEDGLAWVAADPDDSLIRWHEQAGHEQTKSAPGKKQPWILCYGERERTPAGRLHLDVTTTQNGWYLVASFPHAACDGLGAFQFITDWLLIYRNLQSSSADQIRLPRLEPNLLLRRGEIAGVRRTRRQRAKMLWTTINTLRHKPTPLPLSRPLPTAPKPAGVEPDGHDTSTAPNTRCSFAAVMSRTPGISHFPLQSVATRNACTVNDLLIRELFLTIEAWTESLTQCPTFSAPDPLWRIMIPISLREMRHRRIPATNIISIASVSARRSACDDPARLLEVIRDRTHFLKKVRADSFLSTLRLFRRFGFMERFVTNPTCRGTAVFSNVGEPFARFPGYREHGTIELPGCRAIRAIGAPPVRPGTPIAIGAGRHADRLLVSLNYDPVQVTPDEADRFLSLYVQRIEGLNSPEPGSK